MLKKCERCGKEFDARDPTHKICQGCFRERNKGYIPEELLIRSYFNDRGNFIEDIFIDIPERLANIFHYDGLKNTQARYFYNKILRAKEIALREGFDSARPILNECVPEIQGKLNRRISGFTESFASFLKHHLSSIKDERTLEAFYKHIKSVLDFLPR
ncbi:MAG: hypothetical protein ACE5K4_10080 [Candidatus Hydrothermarchaeota archaeon]